ncbi:hypothetical protein KUCAC02_008005, partial [Chaenocephalus aceratus]
MGHVCCCWELRDLTNSSCGKIIDSAQFVIRCNLPSLGKGLRKHVGTKTDLVTANPSIMLKKYGGLMGPRRPFVESLHSYGKSMMVLSPFTYAHHHSAIRHTLNDEQLVASSMDITPDKTTAATSFPTEAVFKTNADKLSEELKERPATRLYRPPPPDPSLTLHPHLVHDFSKPPPFSCSQSWHEIAGCLP